MTKRISLGDIIEIGTSKGLGYAQYVYKHPKYPELIRVLDGIFCERPADLDSLALRRTKFKTFVSLRGLVNDGIFQVVGNTEIPEVDRDFPVFRCGSIDLHTKKVRSWRLWDGSREWLVGDLTAEQRKLPIRNILGAPVLISRIEGDYDYVNAEF